MRIKVATFNIQHGRNHLHFKTTGEEIIDLKRMADAIRDMNVEICGLNEVRDQEGAGQFNQAKEIARHLGWHFCFAPAINIRNGTYGNAIVSKHPITSFRSVPIVTLPEEREPGKHYENRVLLLATIELMGKKIRVMSCHFGLFELEQDRAVDTVLAQANGETAPLLFMGDLNLTPDDARIVRLAESFTDSATVGTGDRMTFPSHAPDRKIDYIFAKNCVVCSSEVPPIIASDHRPILAEIEL